MKEHPRIRREKKTLTAMIDIYCRKFNYTNAEQLAEYKELLAYALKKIDNCPYHEKKPICPKCRIHCYNRKMREKIKKVMKYSGPRIIFRHPYFTLMHFIDSLKKYPEIETKKAAS
ncbi:MAG: nitrous oxide-stimulated promoter family protein [Spirochaetales bacterium]|nr:nitrous oxide-stimulated promoter family protein [Spirochaetales bacterium]